MPEDDTQHDNEMTDNGCDRPQYHLLPEDDPARAVQILRAAAGLGPRQPDPEQPNTDEAEPGATR